MTDKLLIDRETLTTICMEKDGPRWMDAMFRIQEALAAPRQPLSERVPCKEFDKLYAQMLDEYPDEMAKAAGDIRKLAAPRQSYGDGLEVVAYEWTHERGIVAHSLRDSPPFYPNKGSYVRQELCRLSDAQRAVAELREECERLRGLTPELPPRPPEGEVMPRYGLRWNGPQQPVAVPMADGYWTPWHLAEAERDTLRQQRDKLAGLLREALDIKEAWYLKDRIDAALAEVGK